MGCGPLRILVADDNRDAADTAAILLRLSGYDVQTAYGGAEAIDLARAFDPDVAILDINMPSVDGYDVANALVGGSAALRRPLLIALTALSSAEDVRRSSEAGFDHHVVKPAANGALVQLIEVFFHKPGCDGESDGRGPPD
jgi:CheY-like chemotaxis protein